LPADASPVPSDFPLFPNGVTAFALFIGPAQNNFSHFFSGNFLALLLCFNSTCPALIHLLSQTGSITVPISRTHCLDPLQRFVQLRYSNTHLCETKAHLFKPCSFSKRGRSVAPPEGLSSTQKNRRQENRLLPPSVLIATVSALCVKNPV
jgi:hypothetical protein